MLSSLVRKYIMAITGLFLCAFLVVHLFGNMFLYGGPEAFNTYVSKMMSSPFIKLMEIVLVLGFMIHIVDGAVLSFYNRKARQVPYRITKQNETSDLASRMMVISAIVIFVFLVIHLKSFWFQFKWGDVAESMTMYDVVVTAFRDPLYSLFYVVAMGLLFFHLYHGFESAFQSLGLNHARYMPVIKKSSQVFSILMALGFASFPVYFYVCQ